MIRSAVLAALVVGLASAGSAQRYSKKLMKLAQRQHLAEHLDVCAAYQAICHKTEDHAEALAAFFEKRAGRFQGK